MDSAIFDRTELTQLSAELETLAAGFNNLPAFSPAALDEEANAVLHQVAERMQDNFPFFHPLYAGQMLKPPHPLARAAYMLAMWINPNNHALDGGRASSLMEKEAVAQLAAMFGWREALGHLTGGGTMANLEALWVAGQLAPGKKVLASAQAHYTHSRISNVLKLPFESVDTDARGKMSLPDLENRLRNEDIGTVVVTLGTTGIGSVDPLPEILALREKFGFRVHVDAAYGGYFRLVENLMEDAKRAFEAITQADSIVVDPHKHGLQPYGCGCVLFKEPSVGRFYAHDSPYTYFSSAELHLGEISLECSRPGAAAVALWATQKLLPPKAGGAFADNLARSREAAIQLHARLSASDRFFTLIPPELDIVIWAPKAPTLTAISRTTTDLFQACAKQGLHLATLRYPADHLGEEWRGVKRDADTVTCLRSCLMKPEHLDWLDEIWSRLHIASSLEEP